MIIKPCEKERKPLFTDMLTTEEIGTREDGTTYQRFRVILYEDFLKFKRANKEMKE